MYSALVEKTSNSFMTPIPTMIGEVSSKVGTEVTSAVLKDNRAKWGVFFALGLHTAAIYQKSSTTDSIKEQWAFTEKTLNQYNLTVQDVKSVPEGLQLLKESAACQISTTKNLYSFAAQEWFSIVKNEPTTASRHGIITQKLHDICMDSTFPSKFPMTPKISSIFENFLLWLGFHFF